MSGKVVGWAFDVGSEHELAPTVRYVLVAYADNADSDGKCWPEKSKIVEKTGLGRSSVYRSIEKLETEGLLRFTLDEKGRECALLAVSQPSHNGTEESQPGTKPADDASQPGTDASQPGTDPSHSGTRSNKGTVSEPSGTKQQTVDSGDVVAIFDFWKQQTGRNGHTQLTPNRRAAIKARLDEGRDPAFIRRAIANAARSPFHQGKNDRNQRYDDLTLICRNGEKLESFAELGGGGKRSRHSGQSGPSGAIVDPDGCRRAWDAARKVIATQVPDSTYRLWVAPFEAAGKRGKTLVLVDTTEQGGIREWGERRYGTLFLKALGDDFDAIQFVDETELELEAR